MRRASEALLILAGALAAGCAPPDVEWTGTITDSAGVVVVRNTEDPVWTDATAWTLVEDLKIGSVVGDSVYQFGQIGWIDVASDGSIVAVDAQARHVKVFTADGTFVGTIGGPGLGPGQLGEGVAFLSLTAGDTLLVPDIQNRRLSRYALDGTVLESVPLRLDDGIPMNWRSSPERTVAMQRRPLSLPNLPATDSMDVIVSLGTDGLVRDTLRRFATAETFQFSGGVPALTIYAPEAGWTLLDTGRLLFGMNDDYRLGIYRTDGTLERVITMPFIKRPVSDRDRAAVIDFMKEGWREAGAPPAMVEQVTRNIHFGEYFPAFATVLVGPDASIWVQHVRAASELSEEELADFNLLRDSGSPEWDVLDREGRFLGRVRMPDRFSPRIIRGDHLLGVWLDDLDIEYVMRLRIARPTS